MPALSVPEWHEMALQGKAPDMRIRIHGTSMSPLIRIDRDYVTICPLNEKAEVGDIVLFADPNRERYVLHRVWKTGEGWALTWGDNCPKPDGWIPEDRLWGKVTLIERGRRTIRPDRASGMRLARVWHRVGWIWRFGRRCNQGIRVRVRRLFPPAKR